MSCLSIFPIRPAGVFNKVGYAFGLGLERWAMQLYRIPDIRLFWTNDSGFLHQFETDDIHARITYKVCPECWIDVHKFVLFGWSHGIP